MKKLFSIEYGLCYLYNKPVRGTQAEVLFRNMMKNHINKNKRERKSCKTGKAYVCRGYNGTVCGNH